MTHSFLDKVADYIFEHYSANLQALSVVLPNRRAGLFLQKKLAKKSDKPIWSPNFYSIEDFVFAKTALQPIPVLDLVFELYRVHREIEGGKAQSFDRFSGWGQLLLKDFNDIDLYLKDAQYVFKYLSEAKAISLWNLDPENMSPMERDYLNFYGRLGDYYSGLQEQLSARNLAYQGMAYRKFADNIKALHTPGEQIIFAGFNALSPSEQQIFDFYEKSGNAAVLWDIDKYYFEDKNQEAGAFLRKQLQNSEAKDILWIEDNLRTDKKDVHIYGLSGNVSLAKMAGNILEELANKADVPLGEETAVVLANEQLILPMLYSLPENIETFNITMSFPPRLSRVYDLMIGMIDLYTTCFDAAGKPLKSPRYYHRNLENLFLHPLIQQYFEQTNAQIKLQKAIADIRRNNISYVAVESLPELFSDEEQSFQNRMLELLSQKPADMVDLLSIILALLEELSRGKLSVLDAEFVYYYSNMSRRLNDLMQQYPYINEPATLKKLFISLSSAQGIPFSGEPLSGVQIMGMLETRNLDFEHLILLSANEGMLPKARVYQSFILPDIKRELGLPLPADNDSVFAYHFYRLMQRAGNIHILYNTQNETMGQGELSRYVKQMEWEWREQNPNVKWEHKHFHIPLSADEYDTSIRFPKDEFALRQMKYIAGRGFSPSTLNVYKSCTLKFYFQRILGMYNEDSVEEVIEANTLGTVVHDVLEYFYTQIKGKTLTEDFLKNMSQNYKAKLREVFQNVFKKGDIDFGYNRLLQEVAAKFIENYIEREQEMLKRGDTCTIIGLEEELERTLNIEVKGEEIAVKLKGKADRIDRLGNRIRVIDYKTGKVDLSDLRLYAKTLDGLEKMFSIKGEKSFQLMTYAWLYAPKADAAFEMEAGISALKNHSKYMPLMFEEKDSRITEERFQLFEEGLEDLFSRMFGTEEDFEQTDNEQACTYCDYKFICGKWTE